MKYKPVIFQMIDDTITYRQRRNTILLEYKTYSVCNKTGTDTSKTYMRHASSKLSVYFILYDTMLDVPTRLFRVRYCSFCSKLGKFRDILFLVSLYMPHIEVWAGSAECSHCVLSGGTQRVFLLYQSEKMFFFSTS